MLLEVQDLHVFYGKIEAIKGISFNVNEGEIVSLIGANGAGKTTTMRTIFWCAPCCSRSHSVRRTRHHQHGAARPREAWYLSGSRRARNFPGMTVRENLDMGTYIRGYKSATKAADMEHVISLFPRLGERISQMGGTLSGGEQQMLAIGRALMSRPRLMLLDEPSMGLAPMLIAQIFSIVKQINSEGISVLMVEQNATQALKTAHRGYVLETGYVMKTGTGADLLVDPAVRAAYLGG